MSQLVRQRQAQLIGVTRLEHGDRPPGALLLVHCHVEGTGRADRAVQLRDPRVKPLNLALQLPDLAVELVAAALQCAAALLQVVPRAVQRPALTFQPFAIPRAVRHASGIPGGHCFAVLALTGLKVRQAPLVPLGIRGQCRVAMIQALLALGDPPLEPVQLRARPVAALGARLALVEYQPHRHPLAVALTEKCFRRRPVPHAHGRIQGRLHRITLQPEARVHSLQVQGDGHLATRRGQVRMPGGAA